MTIKPVTHAWEHALLQYCERYFAKQEGDSPEWLLVGSVASVLQGVPFEPNDIDVITKTESGLYEIADRMSSLAVETCDLPIRDLGWLSSREMPVFKDTYENGFTWFKGRWKIGGFELEAVHMPSNFGIPDSIEGDGMWEGGRYVWEHKRLMEFHGYTIPVAPLEVQLESNFRRGVEWKEQAIIKTMKERGYDPELIKITLSRANLERFYGELESLV